MDCRVEPGNDDQCGNGTVIHSTERSTASVAFTRKAGGSKVDQTAVDEQFGAGGVGGIGGQIERCCGDFGGGTGAA
jgi:hypothetical protein